MQSMSSSKSRSRAPEGVPTGGQFATERRPEVGPSTLLNLSDPPLLDDTHHAHPERVVYAERVVAFPYEMPHRLADCCPHAGVGKACAPCRAEFARIARIKAEAWEEGYEAAARYHDLDTEFAAPNPYREGAGL